MSPQLKYDYLQSFTHLAHNGSKLIVFGGYTIGKQVLGSIYILDVQTMVWTRGQNTDTSMIRSDMACTVAGDSFIAWGGEYT